MCFLMVQRWHAVVEVEGLCFVFIDVSCLIAEIWWGEKFHHLASPHQGFFFILEVPNYNRFHVDSSVKQSSENAAKTVDR
jgi:hypothetical protein